MNRKKILVIVGTRPEAIKMAPVIRELRARADRFECVVCSTGQHREMLNQALSFFKITPDMDLNIMQANQTLTDLTGRLFPALGNVIETQKPNWILAQGDTTSVLVSGILAYYNQVSFGHVEAGLRTNDKFSPFPEEVNRRMAAVVSDCMFAPTEWARQNLLKEGFNPSTIHVTGNTVVDALQYFRTLPYEWNAGPLSKIDQNQPLVLITAHRRESFGQAFQDLCLAIKKLASVLPEIQFVYPVHLNPNVRKPVQETLSQLPNVHLLEPLDYRSFVAAMSSATLILTDSGGVQEEAPGLGVPVLVMRDTTERPEGIEAGVSKLVGTSTETIFSSAHTLLSSKEARAKMKSLSNPYGDGKASIQIADILERAK